MVYIEKFLLITSLCLIFNTAKGQIGEVKVVGNQAKIYNEDAQYTYKYISLSSNSILLGFNSKNIVIKDGNQAKIYDAGGNYTYKYISLCSSCRVVYVTPSAILVKDGNQVKYYNFDGSYTYKYTSD